VSTTDTGYQGFSDGEPIPSLACFGFAYDVFGMENGPSVFSASPVNHPNLQASGHTFLLTTRNCFMEPWTRYFSGLSAFPSQGL
jgi:hypothetical protein